MHLYSALHSESMGNYVMGLIDGHVQQIGTALEIYQRSNSEEVAGLSGKFSVFEAIVLNPQHNGRYEISIGGKK